MFRRRIPFNQIAVATLLGVVGGMYIYKPMFEPPKKEPSELPKQEPAPVPVPPSDDKSK